MRHQRPRLSTFCGSCTPNTPHLTSFPIQRRKAAGFQPVHSRCGAQLPTTQEASPRAGHENLLLRNSHTSDPIHHLTPAQRESLGNLLLSIFRDLMLLVGNWDIWVMAKFLREWELRELIKIRCYNFTCTLGMSANLSKTWTECLPKSLTLPISFSESTWWSHTGCAFKAMSSKTFFLHMQNSGAGDSAHENVIPSLYQALQSCLCTVTVWKKLYCLERLLSLSL